MSVIDRDMNCASVNITCNAKAMLIATHINTNASAHMHEPIGIGMITIDTFARPKSTAATLIGTKTGTSTAAAVGRRLVLEGATAQIDTTTMQSTITSPLATTMITTILAFAILGQ